MGDWTKNETGSSARSLCDDRYVNHLAPVPKPMVVRVQARTRDLETMQNWYLLRHKSWRIRIQIQGRQLEVLLHRRCEIGIL